MAVETITQLDFNGTAVTEKTIRTRRKVKPLHIKKKENQATIWDTPLTIPEQKKEKKESMVDDTWIGDWL